MPLEVPSRDEAKAFERHLVTGEARGALGDIVAGSTPISRGQSRMQCDECVLASNFEQTRSKTPPLFLCCGICAQHTKSTTVPERRRALFSPSTSVS